MVRSGPWDGALATYPAGHGCDSYFFSMTSTSRGGISILPSHFAAFPGQPMKSPALPEENVPQMRYFPPPLLPASNRPWAEDQTCRQDTTLDPPVRVRHPRPATGLVQDVLSENRQQNDAAAGAEVEPPAQRRAGTSKEEGRSEHPCQQGPLEHRQFQENPMRWYSTKQADLADIGHDGEPYQVADSLPGHSLFIICHDNLCPADVEVGSHRPGQGVRTAGASTEGVGVTSSGFHPHAPVCPAGSYSPDRRDPGACSGTRRAASREVGLLPQNPACG